MAVICVNAGNPKGFEFSASGPGAAFLAWTGPAGEARPASSPPVAFTVEIADGA